MTRNETITVSELTVKMDESEDHHDVIVAFTDYLKGLNPHQITIESLEDLDQAIHDHFNSMNHRRTREPTDIVPSIYSL